MMKVSITNQLKTGDAIVVSMVIASEFTASLR
jgi:hypothetical protein